MKFKQGDVVNTPGGRGIVAGKCKYNDRTDLYTIILNDAHEYCWLWDDYKDIISNGDILDTYCKGKYVYNYRESALKLAQTKLGNIL